MNFTHDEMMLIIQGLRLVNGIDRMGVDYSFDPDDQVRALALLERIDNDADPDWANHIANENPTGTIVSVTFE